MNPQRITLGVLGTLMVAAAMVTYFRTGITDENAVFLGVCSKVGFVLLTIFLAWPSLDGFIEKAPKLVNGIALAALIFVAIRPRLLPLLVGGIVIALVVHFGLRFASSKLGK